MIILEYSRKSMGESHGLYGVCKWLKMRSRNENVKMVRTCAYRTYNYYSKVVESTFIIQIEEFGRKMITFKLQKKVG